MHHSWSDGKKRDGKKVMEVLVYEQGETKKMFLPGTTVRPDEHIPLGFARELALALNTAQSSQKKKKLEALQQAFKEIFTTGAELYRGYVDDARNTDHAWFETLATHYHDEKSEALHQLQFKAAEQGVQLRWVEADPSLPMRSSHLEFIEKACTSCVPCRDSVRCRPRNASALHLLRPPCRPRPRAAPRWQARRATKRHLCPCT